ncbi:MAG TPA: CHASE3 domain-containing protein [Steroidobacteraceae bacterium]|nr:CHASE3 domain-containing protein [Steroidobacteraceae bacterium]
MRLGFVKNLSTSLWRALLCVVLPFAVLIALQAYDVLNPALLRSRQIVSHTYNVIATAQTASSVLQEAQRQQRGYLLLGVSTYLEPYRAQSQKALALVVELQRLTADNPEQQGRILDLEQQIGLLLGLMESEVEAYRRDGIRAAQQIVQDNAGIDAMERVRGTIDSIVAAENGLLTRRLAREADEEQAADREGMAGAVLAFMMMIVGVALAMRTFRKERELQLQVNERAREAGAANQQLRERNAELMRANETAAQASQVAKRASLAKGRFLAMASHDLRHPLQTLVLLNWSLRRQARSSEVVEALGQQERAIGSMSRLLDTLLDISKAESGVLKPREVDFAVWPVLDALFREFRTVAVSKGLELRVDRCSESAHSDPALVQQILSNLVSNAIKYTASGFVHLRCLRIGSCVRIEVSDSGIGISPDQLAYIWDEFYQVGVSSSGSRDGYGLGLSIVQRLVQVLDVKLDVHSELHKGSVFALTLRCAETPLVAEGQQLTREGRHAIDLHIMLVEDDPSVRSAMSLVLQRAGITVTAVASGAEALERAHELKRLDVLVTDFHLRNRETGLQVVESVRALLGVRLKAILLTGDTSPDLKSLAPDPDLRIASKPMRLDELLTLLHSLRAAQ